MICTIRSKSRAKFLCMTLRTDQRFELSKWVVCQVVLNSSDLGVAYLVFVVLTRGVSKPTKGMGQLPLNEVSDGSMSR